MSPAGSLACSFTESCLHATQISLGRPDTCLLPVPPKADTKHFTHESSKSWIYGFAFERQHAEHALVNPVQRFAFDKPMKCLMAQRVLT